MPPDALSTATHEVLETFRAMADIQQTYGPQACQTYIISMTRSPADVLAVLFLARQAGLFAWDGGESKAICRLDVVPLFEQVRELHTCGDDPGAPVRQPAVPGSPQGARQQAAGDDRLLGQQQRRRLPGLHLADLPGAAGPGRGIGGRRV